MATNHILLAPRVVNLTGLLICLGAFSGALYLQHFQGLEPCPLCIFQRVGTLIAALFFGLAAIHDPGARGQRVYALLAAAGALGGGIVAARHLWLQRLPPDQVPACGPGLDYMLDVFPMQEVLSMVFRGSGECARVDWSFLGISLPGWALLVFIGLAAVALFQLLRPYRGTGHA